jgi:hypothetical protein
LPLGEYKSNWGIGSFAIDQDRKINLVIVNQKPPYQTIDMENLMNIILIIMACLLMAGCHSLQTIDARNQQHGADRNADISAPLASLMEKNG